MLFVVFLSACSIEITTDDPVEEEKVYGDEVSFRLDRVQLLSYGPEADYLTFQFDLYLGREDLGIKQPENDYSLYTNDLPEGLQPKTMTIEENGSMCQRPVFPHRCEATITKDDLVKASLEYEIFIEFEDGYMTKQMLSMSLPDMIPDPEIIFPVNEPVQGSDLKIKFKDVGADSYIVEVLLCHPYENDGINPCLDGVEYSLIREDGVLVYEYGDDFYMPSIDVTNEVVEITSSMPVSYEESVQYIVSASVEGDLRDGVVSYVESYASKSFETESEL